MTKDEKENFSKNGIKGKGSIINNFNSQILSVQKKLLSLVLMLENVSL